MYRHNGSDWRADDLSGPHLDASVYVMLEPLAPGRHEVSFSGWVGDWGADWEITVE